MENLEQQIEAFEERSLLFGGKKNLVEILEFIEKNKVSKADLEKALKAIAHPAAPTAVNIIFDPKQFQTLPVQDSPGQQTITLHPEVILRINNIDKKINMIASVIFPENKK